MKGLKLSEDYFNEFGMPMLTEKFPIYKNKIAAGLVGDGSECFGFDDEISRDHDWGPSFCLWLSKNDYETIGFALQNEYQKLPGEFKGFKAREQSQWGGGRVGVFEIGDFYKGFIGYPHAPANLLEWLKIPEVNLAAATNGQVFRDPLGEFTVFRDKLKGFYPEDIRLKKIAARCMTMAQAGQYNFWRCVKRDEYVAAHYAEAQFIDAAISMVFLLNKEYKPFYKWMHKAVRKLPILGNVIHKLLLDLVTGHKTEAGNTLYRQKYHVIEEICQLIIEELKRQGISDSSSDFLLEHSPIVQSRISDPGIKSINVLAG